LEFPASSFDAVEAHWQNLVHDLLRILSIDPGSLNDGQLENQMSKDQKTLKTTKGQVSPRALLQRINRALAKEGEVAKVTRGERWRGDLGDLYIVDRACCITSLSGWTGAIFNIYELHDQHLRVF
jgi:hypothetical protein